MRIETKKFRILKPSILEILLSDDSFITSKKLIKLNEGNKTIEKNFLTSGYFIRAKKKFWAFLNIIKYKIFRIIIKKSI